MKILKFLSGSISDTRIENDRNGKIYPMHEMDTFSITQIIDWRERKK